MVKNPAVIGRIKTDNMFVDGRDEAFNTTRTKPTGDADDDIDIPPEGDLPFPGPGEVPGFRKKGPGKRAKEAFGSG